jgi:hypothetical protein
MRGILFCVVFVALMPAMAYAAKDPCIKCHEGETPGVVGYWKASAHSKAGVTCAKCHGSDEKASHARDADTIVGADVCGRCHKEELGEHRSSRHAIGMKTGQGCTRNLSKSRVNMRTCGHCHEKGSSEPIVDSECAMFLAQSPEMQRQGCSSCHRVEERCDTCHTRHGTDTVLAGRAETCGVCHMGPDHAQLEMWQTSMHGVLHAAGDTKGAPTCATCHMDGGTHNVSRAIATGRPAHLRDKERSAMLDICARCHTRKMAGRSLQDADSIEEQSRALVDEAREIVEALALEGLLVPAPSEREAHPLFGKGLVVGPHMLYENLSSIEAKYFRMKMFHYMSAFKGAFHQNPDYSHWFGNAPLKLALSEIKSDAAALRQVSTLQRRVDNMGRAGFGNAASGQSGSDTLKRDLRELRERVLKKDISEKEYRERKKRLLNSMGL